MVDHVIWDIEARADLLKIVGGQADVCDEDVIFRVVEVEPLSCIGQRRDPLDEGVAHAGVADLRTEGDEGFVLDGGEVVQEGVVAHCAHLFQDMCTEVIVAHPLRHHARHPADFAGISNRSCSHEKELMGTCSNRQSYLRKPQVIAP